VADYLLEVSVCLSVKFYKRAMSNTNLWIFAESGSHYVHPGHD